MPFSSASGVRIHYRISGRGPTSLILIHELGGSLENWNEVVTNLGDSFCVLRYDLRGAGQSDPVSDPFTMEDQADDLERLVDDTKLRTPLLIAGAAAGSAVAVVYAARHATKVSGLILCPPALSVTPDRRQYLTQRSAQAASEGMHAIIDQTLAQSFPPAVIRDLERYRVYRERFLANDPVSYGFANRALAESTADTYAASVVCPVLLLAGRHDPLRPLAHVSSVAASFPNARVAELDSAHIMSQQSPVDLARAILEFRDRLS